MQFTNMFITFRVIPYGNIIKSSSLSLLYKRTLFTLSWNKPWIIVNITNCSYRNRHHLCNMWNFFLIRDTFLLIIPFDNQPFLVSFYFTVWFIFNFINPSTPNWFTIWMKICYYPCFIPIQSYHFIIHYSNLV